MPPCHLGGAFPESDRPRQHGPARQKAPQVVSQVAGTRIAPGRLLAQALQTDCLEVARALRLKLPHRHRIAALHLVERVEQTGALEWRPTGNEFIKDRA